MVPGGQCEHSDIYLSSLPKDLVDPGMVRCGSRPADRAAGSKANEDIVDKSTKIVAEEGSQAGTK